MPVKMITTLLLLAAVAAGRAQQDTQSMVLDDIAAVVGNEIILSSEVKGLVIQTAQQQGISLNDTTALRKLSEELMGHEISEAVLLHHARQAKIEVTDEDVNQQVERHIADLRSRLGEAALERELAAAGQTLQGLREVYRKEVREDLLRQNFLQEHSHELPQVKVTEEEARELFEQQPPSNSPVQVKFQFMVIAPTPGEEEVARAKARIDSLYKVYLGGGVDFAWLAEKNSDDPSASSGGDLGFFSRSEMVKEFEDAAFSMRVGDVRMVQTKYGWHLIRVEARRQKEVKARHILAATRIGEDDWQRAYNEALSYRERVLAGESFFQLAMEHSAEKKGLNEAPGFSVLDNITPPEVRDALKTDLTPVPNKHGARISNVIEARPNGWLIVYELERKEEAPLAFEDVKQQVIERLEYPKRIQAYIDQLRERTYIDIRFKGWAPIAGTF